MMGWTTDLPKGVGTNAERDQIILSGAEPPTQSLSGSRPSTSTATRPLSYIPYGLSVPIQPVHTIIQLSRTDIPATYSCKNCSAPITLRAQPTQCRILMPECGEMIFPEYDSYLKQVKSFARSWSIQNKQTPEQLARSGFFHQPLPNQPDRVICFKCGVVVFDWLPSDDPDVTHYRWSKHYKGIGCIHVRVNCAETLRKNNAF